MNTPFLRFLLLGAILLLAGHLAASAQDPLNAPTGTYAGTLTLERSMTLKGEKPRTVKHRQAIRVTGFGYVPAGATRTFIRLIAPPRAVIDLSEREYTFDFDPEPPLITSHSGSGSVDLLFPEITIKNTVVTVILRATFDTTCYSLANVRTFRIVRTKP